MQAPDPPTGGPVSLRWARLRFAIVGPLLASPAEPGELAHRLAELAARPYQHPTTGEPIRFSVKTIERWYYAARNQADPVGALARKVPKHAGTHPSVSAELAAALRAQYRDHPRWSYQLHHDNLVALGQQRTELGPVPGYATVCRFMKHEGLLRQRRRRRRGEPVREHREMRSFEVEHVHALWHLDFHEGSRKVTTPTGELRSVHLLGVLDDHSRLCCHLQWYFSETAEALCHGLSQAIQKRGLPRALLTDNGAAMLAAETREGLERLGVVHYTTLPETPEQNGKQETFWRQVEGRLLPMLEGEPELTLTLLNTATQAWVERDYHRRRHEELGEAPLQRYLRASNVGRTSPDSERASRSVSCRTASPACPTSSSAPSSTPRAAPATSTGSSATSSASPSPHTTAGLGSRPCDSAGRITSPPPCSAPSSSSTRPKRPSPPSSASCASSPARTSMRASSSASSSPATGASPFDSGPPSWPPSAAASAAASPCRQPLETSCSPASTTSSKRPATPAS